MPIVQAEIMIAAAPESVFDLAQDYGLRLAWDPFLADMEFLNGAQAAAVGTHVRVRARSGLSMEVEYIALNRPMSVAMRMVRGPWFFENFAGTWRFEASGSQTTRVTFRYSFRTKPRMIRGALEPLIALVFGRDIRRRLAGLKRGVEQAGLLDRLGPLPAAERASPAIGP